MEIFERVCIQERHTVFFYRIFFAFFPPPGVDFRF